MLSERFHNGAAFYEDPEHPYLTITVDEYPDGSVVTVNGPHMFCREYETERFMHSHTCEAFLAFADSLEES